MSALSAKIRKARELRVEAGGFVFTVLRPTPLEREEKIRGESAARGILSLVIGWENVTEGDLIGEPPEGALGAFLHAPVSARVESVGDSIVLVKA